MKHFLGFLFRFCLVFSVGLFDLYALPIKENKNPLDFLSEKNREIVLKKFLKGIPSDLKSEEKTIPKIIHQIWIGGPLPEKFAWMVESWKNQHPDWQFCLWTDEKVKDFDFELRKEFDEALNFGVKADILRYEILNRYGGMYVDIDYECLKNFDSVIKGCDFFSCFMGGGYITNAMIGCTPNHPILQNCVQKIKGKNFRLNNFNKILELSGPIFFTHRIIEFVLKENFQAKLSLYPEEFSFPMPSSKRGIYWKGKMKLDELNSYKNKGAYAIHYWATSWQE